MDAAEGGPSSASRRRDPGGYDDRADRSPGSVTSMLATTHAGMPPRTDEPEVNQLSDQLHCEWRLRHDAPWKWTEGVVTGAGHADASLSALCSVPSHRPAGPPPGARDAERYSSRCTCSRDM
jgi:hypothetical protein